VQTPRVFLARLFADHLGAKTDAALDRTIADDLVEPLKRAAANEQDIGGIDLRHFLVRMLASAMRRHGSHRTFDNLEQRLLHAFARHIARDRRVFALARDLVDFVDEHNAALGFFDIVIALSQELGDDVLDILAHIPGLCQRGRISDHERHIEHLGQRLRQISLARARRPDQEDIGLGELNILALARPFGRQTLVVVVNRHRQNLLGAILTNHILIERFTDFGRQGQALAFRRLH